MKIKSILKEYFLTGLLVLVPIGLTVLIIYYLFQFLGGIAKYIPQLTTIHPIFDLFLRLVMIAIIITVVGFLFSSLATQRLLLFIENTAVKLPVIKHIYVVFKQLSETIVLDKKSLGKPILVEYPRKGCRVIAFKTKENQELANKNYTNIFIPVTLFPPSGFLLHVKKDDYEELDMTADEAIKLIFSTGILGGKSNK